MIRFIINKLLGRRAEHDALRVDPAEAAFRNTWFYLVERPASRREMDVARRMFHDGYRAGETAGRRDLLE